VRVAFLQTLERLGDDARTGAVVGCRGEGFIECNA
jgi:hypothetical protein